MEPIWTNVGLGPLSATFYTGKRTEQHYGQMQ